MDVHVILAAGQSNMEGRGTPYSTTTDPTNPRIWQYPRPSSALKLAAEPLDDPRLIRLGIGPAFQFARRLLQTLPDEDEIVIVPAAVGNTGLVENTADAWKWGISGNLSDLAATQTIDAITAAEIQWPTADVKVAAILWVQGERDGRALSITKPAYLSALSALVYGWRTIFGDFDIPFIIGQMVPEGLTVGTAYQINSAHSAAPYTIDRAGFALGPAEMHVGDDLHYTGSGQRKLSRQMFKEYMRVTSGLSPLVAEQPTNRTETLVRDTFTQHGTTVCPDPDLTRQSVTVTFPEPFGGVPTVVPGANIGGDRNVTWAYAAGVTKTKFDLYYRAGAAISDRPISWIAAGPAYEG